MSRATGVAACTLIGLTAILLSAGVTEAEAQGIVLLAPGKAPNGSGSLNIGAGSDDDRITIRRVPGIADPSKFFYEVEISSGIYNVPEGCFRKDENTIHCPVELVGGLTVNLGDGNDQVLNQTALPAAVFGGQGIDFLDGDGNDTLNGGPGNDTIYGQAGNDKLLGGSGNDRIYGGQGKDIVDCGPGKHDLGVGGPGRDLGRRCETVKH
jgi:Ca2+-binding RTX toxin-like protein